MQFIDVFEDDLEGMIRPIRCLRTVLLYRWWRSTVLFVFMMESATAKYMMRSRRVAYKTLLSY